MTTLHISTEVMPTLIFATKPRQHFIHTEAMPMFIFVMKPRQHSTFALALTLKLHQYLHWATSKLHLHRIRANIHEATKSRQHFILALKSCQYSSLPWSYVNISFAPKPCQHPWRHEATSTFHLHQSHADIHEGMKLRQHFIHTKAVPTLMKPHQNFICIKAVPTFMKPWQHSTLALALALKLHQFFRDNIAQTSRVHCTVAWHHDFKNANKTLKMQGVPIKTLKMQESLPRLWRCKKSLPRLWRCKKMPTKPWRCGKNDANTLKTLEYATKTLKMSKHTTKNFDMARTCP